MRLRGADAVTIARVAIVLIVAYLVIVRFDAVISILLLAISIVMDSLDGFIAIRESSKGRIGLSDYIEYLMHRKGASKIRKIKEDIARSAPWGPRADVAGDRITEYVMWILFTFLHVIPLFILLIVVIRHSVADAFMGSRGTSSKASSWMSRVFYTSNWSRAAINVLKFLTFAYLILVFVLSYPIYIAYILVGVTVAFIVIRGVAEVYDSFLFSRGGVALR